MATLLYCLAYLIIGFLFVKLLKLDPDFKAGMAPDLVGLVFIIWPFWVLILVIYGLGAGLNRLFVAIGKLL